jgi:uncharacterized protein
MVIADTGFWLAVANEKDGAHKRAVRALDELSEPLVTTWPVMTETCHLLLARLGLKAELSFVRGLAAGAFTVFELASAHRARVLTLMQQYADLPMDLADASLVILAEYLGHGRILSTDTRDFQTYRWKNNKPFENLMVR